MQRPRWVSVLAPGRLNAARLLISLAILACALLRSSAFAAAAEQPAITRDLKADAALAARARQPLLLFFSLSGCPFCERVRREYLAPMVQDPAQARRALIRELPIEATLPDFDGQSKTAEAIAQRYKVTVFPTIVMVDAHGTEIAEPLVGFSSPDFYGGLLDGRIDTANGKLKN